MTMTSSNRVSLPEPGKPKLLDQVRHRCRVRHLALKTEQAYVGWVERFIRVARIARNVSRSLHQCGARVRPASGCSLGRVPQAPAHHSVAALRRLTSAGFTNSLLPTLTHLIQL
jgi:hypothetical protein